MMRATFLFFLVALIAALPLQSKAEQTPGKENITKQISNLQVKTEATERKALNAVEVLADRLSRKVKQAKNEIPDNDTWQDDPVVRPASRSDVEKKREQLRKDIAEWRSLLDYTDLKEIRTGLGDALMIAEADGLDIDALTSIFERMKQFIRENDFRESETTVADRLKNLDLERADDDQRMRELIAKLKFLEQEIEATPALQFWTRESLKAEKAGVVIEILQHQMNITHEDIAQPMYLVMDGLLSSITALGRFTSDGRKALKSNELEDHSFDWGATRDLAESYSLKLVTLGFEGEALAAEAAAKRQAFRLNLYKKATIAYIEALIAGRDPAPPCNAKDKKPVTIEYKGEQIKTLGCPDPVVEKLKAYQKIFLKFQSAEAGRLVAEAEMLTAQQQIIADFMAAIPLVGDAIDIYSIYSGETLAGDEMSPIERGLFGTMVLLPIVGPSAVKQAAARLEKVVDLELIKEFLGSILFYGMRAADDLNTVRRDMIIYFAKQVDTKPELLKRLYHTLVDVPYYIDDAARARMKLWKTMRDAAEGKIEVALLKNHGEFDEIYRRASRESNDLVDRVLVQGYNGGSSEGAWALRARNSNIPEPQLREFEAVAREEQAAIVMRPVGPDAAEKIGQNLAATKPLSIKPKSANWGPQKAFIPVEQEFSKLGNRAAGNYNLDEIAKYQAKAEKCFASVPPCANKVGLKVPVGDSEMAVVIVKQGDIEIPVYKNAEGRLYDPDTLKPLSGSEVDTSKMRPLEVFADAEGVPITADYDALALGKRRSGGSTEGFDVAMQRQVPHEAGPKGTITKEMDQLVDELNAAGERAGYTKGKLVHHGPEVFNPGSERVFQPSEIKEQLSLTVIDPDYGVLTIPHCDEKCMVIWCKESGMCDPSMVCPPGVRMAQCIPVDPDRLLKDYFHNARLRDIDISPHSSWGWGPWNGLSGWNLTTFLDDVPPKLFVEAGSSTSYLAQKSLSGYFGNFLSLLVRAEAMQSTDDQGQR